jgi:hypothetical protein
MSDKRVDFMDLSDFDEPGQKPDLAAKKAALNSLAEQTGYARPLSKSPPKEAAKVKKTPEPPPETRERRKRWDAGDEDRVTFAAKVPPSTRSDFYETGKRLGVAKIGDLITIALRAIEHCEEKGIDLMKEFRDEGR